MMCALVIGRRPSLRELTEPFNLVVILGGGLIGLSIGLVAGASRPADGLIWLLLGAGLVQPALEELLFRGVIQGQLLDKPRLARRRLGVSGANALATVAFALLHLIHRPPLTAALVVVPSLIYGHSRERYGGVAVPFLQHAVHNIALFLGFALA
ncbi:JDVT-CTERM system CAAX-type protease [Ectothiorhodospiraceae bacterium WFHF3C12]|nr:JDVT-CTERM system CAAX-type protease [Ectothiorhodospiraceae bacterium WFHF3C12]